MNIAAISAILNYTFKDSIRAKWLLIFALVFFLLAINIPTLVLLTVRYIPPNYLQVYLTSLIGLAFPFIPLLSLPMGATTIVEERESGTLQYILSNPISKADFLLGRLFGMLAATTLVILLGFGIASLFVYNIDVTRYAPVITATFVAALLNAIMLGVAMVISVLSKRKSTAIGIAIFLWFLFTVLSDLGFLSIIANLKGGATAALPVILLNPVESSRILGVLALGGTASELGSTGLILDYSLGSSATTVITLSLAAWLIVFFTTAFLLFRHQDVA